MARGWESKSVEHQQALSDERRQASTRQRLPDEVILRQQQIASLQLTRTRVLHDIQTATHERYRKSLEAALQHIDARIAAIGDLSGESP